MRSSKDDLAERALASVLDALASVLVELEITPTRLAQIARTAFVRACADEARVRSSGRPHFARIAARTGLTRSEVKRIVASNFQVRKPDTESLPRALRVLQGWHLAHGYSNMGRPRKLRIIGPAPSFDSLCKAFSGDIPHRVILEELERRGRVIVSRGRKSVVVAPKSQKETRGQRELTTLTFAAMQMAAALRHDAIVVKRKVRISTSQGIPDNYVERAVAGRLTELLDQFPELFARKSKPKRHVLNVFTLVTRVKK